MGILKGNGVETDRCLRTGAGGVGSTGAPLVAGVRGSWWSTVGSTMFGAVGGHELPFESFNELITFVPIGLGREGSFLAGDTDEVFRIGCTI